VNTSDGSGSASIHQLETNRKKMETASNQCMITAEEL
jgi:hypothetical protein